MEDLKKLINKQEFLFELLGKGDITVNEKENGITISFKEIYDEVKKTSNQVSDVSKRVENMEKKMDQQEKMQKEQERLKKEFRQKFTITLIGFGLTVGFGVLVFAIKGGAF